jgi:hypothetical protein
MYYSFFAYRAIKIWEKLSYKPFLTGKDFAHDWMSIAHFILGDSHV